jgi:hypothetical protein
VTDKDQIPFFFRNNPLKIRFCCLIVPLRKSSVDFLKQFQVRTFQSGKNVFGYFLKSFFHAIKQLLAMPSLEFDLKVNEVFLFQNEERKKA